MFSFHPLVRAHEILIDVKSLFVKNCWQKKFEDDQLRQKAEENQDRGEPRGSAPPTPPDMRFRIRRFGGLSYTRTINLGIPSESK